MTDKELRKISRKELLEIMLAQTNRIEELELALEEANQKLNSKKIIIKESGSLAEASLKLSGIFEQAQQVAEEYIKNVQENCLFLEKETKKECRELKKKMLKDVEEKCQKLEAQTEKRLQELEKKTTKKRKSDVSKTSKLEKKKNNLNAKTSDTTLKVISKKRRKKVVKS